MSSSVSDTSSTYRWEGPLIDSNLLLLLFVGLRDRNRIQKFKRTAPFAIKDFERLAAFIRRFKEVIGRRIHMPNLVRWLLVGLAFAVTSLAAAPPKIPIILDTDIGTDIDDAFALALVVNSPELELLGVTTVAGDTQARARLAAKLLWEAGGAWRKVPVYAGEPGTPQPIEQTRWAKGFTSSALHMRGAVDFMKMEINRRPGRVTLITIGELTNVAALLKSDPSMAKKIKLIAMMGGSVARGYAPDSKPEAEWNIKSNPQAAQTVFSSGVPLLMAPLDVTAMLQLDAAGRRRVFTQLTPLTNALTILYHLWGNETPTLFDPMAVAMLIDSSLCETQQLAIEVDAQGFTRVVEGKPANATVGMHADPKRFFEFYLSRVAP